MNEYCSICGHKEIGGCYMYEDKKHGVYRLAKWGGAMPVSVCSFCYCGHLKACWGASESAQKIVKHIEEKLREFRGIDNIPPKALPVMNPPILSNE